MFDSPGVSLGNVDVKGAPRSLRHRGPDDHRVSFVVLIKRLVYYWGILVWRSMNSHH